MGDLSEREGEQEFIKVDDKVKKFDMSRYKLLFDNPTHNMINGLIITIDLVSTDIKKTEVQNDKGTSVY